MPAVTDNLTLVADAGSETYLAGTGKAIGATSIQINDATGWPTITAVIFAIRVVDSSGNEIVNSYTEWIGVLSGTTLALGSSPSPLLGSDQEYAAGATTQVYVLLSSARENKIIQALLNQHNQDGSHGDITAGTITAAGEVTANDGAAVTGGLTVDSMNGDGGTVVAATYGDSTTTSTSYGLLADDVVTSVTATIGSSGKALVILGVHQSNATNGGFCYMSFEASGANTIAVADNGIIVKNATANTDTQLSFVVTLTDLTPGATTFELQYRVGSGTGNFQNRSITVVPLPF